MAVLLMQEIINLEMELYSLTYLGFFIFIFLVCFLTRVSVKLFHRLKTREHFDIPCFTLLFVTPPPEESLEKIWPQRDLDQNSGSVMY